MMIPFKNEPYTWRRLDYRIMMRGFLKAYTDYALLKKDMEWLTSEDYKIIEFDCREWTNTDIIHFSLSSKIDYVNGTGYAWGCLDESLNELEIKENGLVVLFDYFDFINFKMSEILIDCFVKSAQRHVLFNQRLLILIKVEKNRNFKLNPFGAYNFHWY